MSPPSLLGRHQNLCCFKKLLFENETNINLSASGQRRDKKPSLLCIIALFLVSQWSAFINEIVKIIKKSVLNSISVYKKNITYPMTQNPPPPQVEYNYLMNYVFFFIWMKKAAGKISLVSTRWTHSLTQRER